MNKKTHQNLESFNAYRIPAVCKEAYFPQTEDDVSEFICSFKKQAFYILGNGNNVILAKEYYDAPFLILNKCFEKIEIDNDIIVAESGATLLDISRLAQQHGLTGLEEFYDIPSSVGGAVIMNAGNKNTEIKDILVKVRYINLLTGEVKEASSGELDFSYRNSLFQNSTNLLVLKAWFKLTKDDPEKIQSRMETAKKMRWEKQPREYPNCGSVFKRPEGRFVGPMIDELGLKGFTIGGAQISAKHSGFIVNVGNASGADILAVINEIKVRVKNHFDVDLEVEQRIIT